MLSLHRSDLCSAPEYCEEPRKNFWDTQIVLNVAESLTQKVTANTNTVTSDMKNQNDWKQWGKLVFTMLLLLTSSLLSLVCEWVYVCVCAIKLVKWNKNLLLFIVYQMLFNFTLQ